MTNYKRFTDLVEINPRVHLIKGVTYPFVPMEAVTPGRRYVSAQTQRVFSDGGTKFQAGDTLFARITPCLENGKITQFAGPSDAAGFGSTEFLIFRHRAGISDPAYIFYLATSDIVRKPAEKSLSGASGRQRADLAAIRDVQVPAPSLTTQRKIAAILSAYDDLIENNTRRIAILEEMARALYREWFVNFRFPGYEATALVESPLGPIPGGWEVKRLRDVATIYRGRSYRSSDLVDEEGLPFLNLKCIERDGGFRLDGLKAYSGPYKDSQTAKAGDIIMAVTDMTQERRLVAHAARVPDNGNEILVLSMDLVKIAPHHHIGKEYLYGMLRFSGFPDAVKQYANGANVLHLNPERIEEFMFALPPVPLRSRFSEFCCQTYQQCDVLARKVLNLRQTRDLLLPRLISGAVDVEGLAVNAGNDA